MHFSLYEKQVQIEYLLCVTRQIAVLSLYCRRRCDDLSSPVKPLKKERRLELSLGTCLTVYVIVDLLCLVC